MAYEETDIQEDVEGIDSYQSPKGILTWGRFERYGSPVFDDEVWRIGCVADGSCFFHATLTASDRNYRALGTADREEGESERRQFVKEVT